MAALSSVAHADTYRRDERGDLAGLDRKRRRGGRRAWEHCALYGLCLECWENRRPDTPGEEYRLGYGLADGGTFFHNDTTRLCTVCLTTKRERYVVRPAPSQPGGIVDEPGPFGDGGMSAPRAKPVLPESIVMYAAGELPQLEILTGDRIVFRFGETEPVVLWRPLRNVGAILRAFERGTLTPLTACPPTAVIAEALGVSIGPEPSRPAAPPPVTITRGPLGLVGEET